MNYEEKRKYLESFAYLDLQVEELLNEKRKWLNRALELTQSDCENVSSAVHTNKILRKVDMLERKIDELIDQIIDKRTLIVERIEKLDDEALKLILFEKYINSRTFESISEEMGYCTKQIARKHKKAIEQLDLS